MSKLFPRRLATRLGFRCRHIQWLVLRYDGDAEMKTCRRLLLLAACCLALMVPKLARAAAGWNLVWSDEFALPNGSSPDSSKWTFDLGAGGWGNNELEYYTSRTNNARIENGQLVIEARQENYSGANYTSARLKTQGKASWAYGRVEARIKIPRTQGIWPAFWMLGTNITSVGWPACGEIDIMENIGREPTQVHGTIHGPGYSGGGGIGAAYSLPGNAPFADDFHEYAIEWTTNRIQWFVDGVQYFSATPASLPGGTAWVFTQPQFIILNVAVGGNWPGYPDGTTVFPQRMLVDYVRVYAATNAATTNSSALLNGNFENGTLAPWLGKGACCANTLGGYVLHTNGLVWDPTLNGNNTQGIHNPAFGAYSCKIYGNFSGGPNTPGIFQDVDASPGSLWTASIQARTQNTDHIRGSNHAVAEVSFLDAGSNVLARYASPVFSTNTPINTWITLNITNQVYPAGGGTNRLAAPAGTAKLRFEVTFSQTLYDWGSIYFDEAQLQPLSIPEAPTLLVGFNDPGQVWISFATQSGLNYQVLAKNALTDLTWNPVETIPGDGTTKTVSYPATTAAQFFSVQVF